MENEQIKKHEISNPDEKKFIRILALLFVFLIMLGFGLPVGAFYVLKATNEDFESHSKTYWKSFVDNTKYLINGYDENDYSGQHNFDEYNVEESTTDINVEYEYEFNGTIEPDYQYDYDFQTQEQESCKVYIIYDDELESSECYDDATYSQVSETYREFLSAKNSYNYYILVEDMYCSVDTSDMADGAKKMYEESCDEARTSKNQANEEYENLKSKMQNLISKGK